MPIINTTYSQSGTNTSDATATASQILSPYTAYVASGKVTGTYIPPSFTPQESTTSLEISPTSNTILIINTNLPSDFKLAFFVLHSPNILTENVVSEANPAPAQITIMLAPNGEIWAGMEFVRISETLENYQIAGGFDFGSYADYVSYNEASGQITVDISGENVRFPLNINYRVQGYFLE